MLFVSGCKQSSEKQSHSSSTNDDSTTRVVFIPEFNADSAYAFAGAQVAFGPRVPNTEAHEACFLYLQEKLISYCDTLYVQKATAKAWNGDVLKMKNLIGVFNPLSFHRILLCAHWDTRPYADHDDDPAAHRTPIEGANDGASGIGVLLEVARQLKIHPVDYGIDIIFFDAEDYGEPRDTRNVDEEFWCLGSQHWSRNPHTPYYRARFGILLDMVGVPDARFYMEGTSMYFASDIVRYVWDAAHKAGFARYFINKESPPIIDDHLYVNRYANIPTINIIHYEESAETGFFHHWHTLDDTMEHVDVNTLNAVGGTLMYVIHTNRRPA